MRSISILGDSISTFEGFNPTGYAVYYDRYRQALNGLTNAYDTWWAQVNQRLPAKLCVNASYSGSRVSGDHFPAASSPDRIRDLKTDKLSPDTILVYIGFNDYGYDVDPGVFELAYCRMLDRLQSVYPNAEIVCGTLMKTRIRGRENWHFPECAFGTPFEEFNDIIRRSCASCGCRLADLDALHTRYETLDGSHPTKTGHMEIAEAWLRCLLMPES